MCGFIRTGAASVIERVAEPDSVLLQTLALASHFCSETRQPALCVSSETCLLPLRTPLSLLTYALFLVTVHHSELEN